MSYNPNETVFNYNFTGAPDTLSFTPPITGTNVTIGLTIDWGDGTIPDNVIPHPYDFTSLPLGTTKDNITVIISGINVTTINNQSNTTAQYLISCIQIGTGITSLQYGFGYCSNLQNVPNTIPSGITIMQDTFNQCINFNQPLNNWDVSNVVDMNGMFYGATIFNQYIGNWNVSKVTKMDDM
jgi:surface protein